MHSVDELSRLLEESTHGTIMGIAPGDPLSKVLNSLGPRDPGPRGLRVYGLLEVFVEDDCVKTLYLEIPDDLRVPAPSWMEGQACHKCDTGILEVHVGRSHITLHEATMTVLSFATW